MPIFNLPNLPVLSLRSLLYPYVDQLYSVNTELPGTSGALALERRVSPWMSAFDDDLPEVSELPTSSSSSSCITSPDASPISDIAPVFILLTSTAIEVNPDNYHIIESDLVSEIQRLKLALRPSIKNLAIYYDSTIKAFKDMLNKLPQLIVEVSFFESSESLQAYFSQSTKEAPDNPELYDKVYHKIQCILAAYGAVYHQIRHLHTLVNNTRYSDIIVHNINKNEHAAHIQSAITSLNQLSALLKFDDVHAMLLKSIDSLMVKSFAMPNETISSKQRNQAFYLYYETFKIAFDFSNIIPRMIQGYPLTFQKTTLATAQFSNNFYAHLYLVFLRYLLEDGLSEEDRSKLAEKFESSVPEALIGAEFITELRDQCIKLLSLNIDKDNTAQVNAYLGISKRAIEFLILSYKSGLTFGEISSLDLAMLISAYNKLVYNDTTPTELHGLIALRIQPRKAQLEKIKQALEETKKTQAISPFEDSCFFELYILTFYPEHPSNYIDIKPLKTADFSIDKKMLDIFKILVGSYVKHFNEQGLRNFATAFSVLVPQRAFNTCLAHLNNCMSKSVGSERQGSERENYNMLKQFITDKKDETLPVSYVSSSSSATSSSSTSYSDELPSAIALPDSFLKDLDSCSSSSSSTSTLSIDHLTSLPNSRIISPATSSFFSGSSSTPSSSTPSTRSGSGTQRPHTTSSQTHRTSVPSRPPSPSILDTIGTFFDTLFTTSKDTAGSSNANRKHDGRGPSQ